MNQLHILPLHSLLSWLRFTGCEIRRPRTCALKNGDTLWPELSAVSMLSLNSPYSVCLTGMQMVLKHALATGYTASASFTDNSTDKASL